MKGKVVPALKHHDVKTHENTGRAVCTLNPDTRSSLRGQLHTLVTLPLKKQPLVHIGYETGWTP
jgi:hypothetical protein